MPQKCGMAVYGTISLSLMGERTGDIMRRLFILLTVCTLILAGCSGQSKQPITESQSVETTSQVGETVSTEIEDTEVVETAEVESTEESVQADAEEHEEEPEPTAEPEKPQQNETQEKPEETAPLQEQKPELEPPVSTEAPTPAPTEPEKPTEAPAEVETVAYDPYEVVSLATAKTKAYGKISIPEDLDNMLAGGEITKEEYDEYYPYDGAGYYSVFVETDLNQAATTSGRKLGSVDGIASYIAEMLSLETGPYFYIEYAGVHSINGTDFYEFRCYRA